MNVRKVGQHYSDGVEVGEALPPVVAGIAVGLAEWVWPLVRIFGILVLAAILVAALVTDPVRSGAGFGVFAGTGFLYCRYGVRSAEEEPPAEEDEEYFVNLIIR